MEQRLIAEPRQYKVYGIEELPTHEAHEIKKLKLDITSLKQKKRREYQQSRHYINLDDSSNEKMLWHLRGGVDIRYLYGDNNSLSEGRGIVLKRRGQYLVVKNFYPRRLFVIFLYAARQDWSVYRKKIIAINLVKMERRLAQCRPEVQKVAEKCKQAYKYGALRESDVNIEKNIWFDYYQLNAEEKKLINRYVTILREWKPIYKGNQ